MSLTQSDYPFASAGDLFRVPYAEIAQLARSSAQKMGWKSAAEDVLRTELVLIDVQNTFCLPGFELFVGGRSGTAAVEDNQRLQEFIIRNIASISGISATLDTHSAFQIFHPAFFINQNGEHPTAYSDLQVDDLLNGTWKFNPSIAPQFGISSEYGQARVVHYAQTLAKKGKFALTIWPYHAMLGGVGHALVPAIEQAIFFHSIARYSPADLMIKGRAEFTENYSALSPEVLFDVDDQPLGYPDDSIFQKLLRCDRMIITGQAKSHCVAWTVSDLLTRIKASDPSLAKKVYLLEDCTSPVVVPGVVDHTENSDKAFEEFYSAGIKPLRASDSMD